MSKRKSIQLDENNNNDSNNNNNDSNENSDNDLNGPPPKKLLYSYKQRLTSAKNDILCDMPYERNNSEVSEPHLDVIVHPNKSRDDHELRDLKSLSGGERSFSTVACLISLWAVVDSPVLFLDEFDVFMDQINRRNALELMIDSAKKKYINIFF